MVTLLLPEYTFNGALTNSVNSGEVGQRPSAIILYSSARSAPLWTGLATAMCKYVLTRLDDPVSSPRRPPHVHETISIGVIGVNLTIWLGIRGTEVLRYIKQRRDLAFRVHSPIINTPKLCPVVYVDLAESCSINLSPQTLRKCTTGTMRSGMPPRYLGSVITPHSSYMELYSAQSGPSHTSWMLDSMGARPCYKWQAVAVLIAIWCNLE